MGNKVLKEAEEQLFSKLFKLVFSESPFHWSGFVVTQPQYQTVNLDGWAAISCEHNAPVNSVVDVRLNRVSYVNWFCLRLYLLSRFSVVSLAVLLTSQCSVFPSTSSLITMKHMLLRNTFLLRNINFTHLKKGFPCFNICCDLFLVNACSAAF